MRRLLFVALLACALVACKRKKNLDGRLDELEVIRNDTCACQDTPCREYQRKVVAAWQMRNDSTDAAKAKPAQKTRYARLYHEFQACDSGATPPMPTPTPTPTPTTPTTTTAGSADE